MHSFHRDGQMRVDGNEGATKGYSPNSIGEWEDNAKVRPPHLKADGNIDHHSPYDDKTDDCFYQAGDLFRLMTEDKKQLLISNTAADIAPVTDNVKYRHAAHCYLADKDYGLRLAKALDLDIARVEALAAMSEPERLLATRSE